MKNKISMITVLLLALGGCTQSTSTLDATQAINAAKEIELEKVKSKLDKVVPGDTASVLEATDELITLTKNYQDELKKINPFIAKSENVRYLFEIQTNTTKVYGRNVYLYDNHFTAEERTTYRNTLKALLEDSFRELENLDVVLKQNFYSKSDDERIEILSGIEDNLRVHEKDMISMEEFGRAFYNAAERVKGGNRFMRR